MSFVSAYSDDIGAWVASFMPPTMPATVQHHCDAHFEANLSIRRQLDALQCLVSFRLVSRTGCSDHH